MFKLSSLPQAAVSLIPDNLISNNKQTIGRVPLKLRSRMIDIMPKILRPSLRLLPFSAQKALLLPALSSVFQEPIEDGDFEFLQDKWLKISIIDLDLNWWLSFDKDKLVMASMNELIASKLTEDVSFSATGDDLILIAGRKQDPDTLFFQRRLKIEGDTELGLEVKNLIDAIDIDQLPSSVHSLVAFSADFLQNTRDELVNL
ncbi:ubiquinone anaerobic biosynthesis accessory factor UbiT [Candidatus Colwellia aromaticivorans]|uniref:ubiquinone anaerobic biosynthesis accessory factor UbiT n=1 Tax=Candidatus Colwellia aromaticivorans TaxID=2267621 RepID=UPI001FE37F46|nr:SCP2 sterol-binding domain-containing protein [Candidatus Colwellia aromaticivorans]